MNVALPGIGSHHSARRGTDEWATPPFVIDALGGWASFDLDPCCPADGLPWATAARSYHANGLEHPWHGRVWLNPPYSEVGPWVARLAGHGTGTALVFARTDTAWFQRYVFAEAGAVFFLAGRLAFLRRHEGSIDGGPVWRPAGHNAGGPSVLAAYGDDDVRRLMAAGGRLAGTVVRLR